MSQQTALICHGGAGTVADTRIPDCREGVATAVEVGREALARGESAVAVVEQVVVALEDHPQFNAGYGSVLDERGQISTDAAIMSGPEQQAGAVALLEGIANPIRVARRVLEAHDHVLLAAEGAREFARAEGFAFCEPASLETPHERARYEERHGTVGAVARDQAGRLAVATSTGGVVGKQRGRIGDSPLPGCGTFANEQVAISCTGTGEAFMRTALAQYLAREYAWNPDLAAVARQAIAHMEQMTGGSGGLIAVDHQGRISHAKNSRQMAVAGFGLDGELPAQV